jgi:hypothetical protein
VNVKRLYAEIRMCIQRPVSGKILRKGNDHLNQSHLKRFSAREEVLENETAKAEVILHDTENYLV